MKKIIVILAALVLISGAAYATGIPEMVEPKNYPIVWVETVYNGGSSAIATGMVVQWDYDTSDSIVNAYDDMCPWVKLADAADDIWTAGVTTITRNIPALSRGQIIIRGPAVVQDGAGISQTTVNTQVGANSSGYVADFTGGAADKTMLGIVIKAVATNQGYTGDPLIHVDVTTFDDG